MAEKRMSELTAATELQSTDVLLLLQEGETKQLPASVLQPTMEQALAAEAAQAGAEAAQGLAEAARGAAEAARTGAETAQGAAETAQGAAEAAQAGAETAQGLAEAARGAAEAARTGAETAQGLAETTQGAAEAARTGAETAQGLAETAQGAAEAAQAAAEAAATSIDLPEIVTGDAGKVLTVNQAETGYEHAEAAGGGGLVYLHFHTEGAIPPSTELHRFLVGFSGEIVEFGVAVDGSATDLALLFLYRDGNLCGYVSVSGASDGERTTSLDYGSCTWDSTLTVQTNLNTNTPTNLHGYIAVQPSA